MPLDWESLSSIFTPRFPVTNRKHRTAVLSDEEIARLSQPEQPKFEPVDTNLLDIGLNRPGVIGDEDYRRRVQAIEQPVKPIAPNFRQSLGAGVEKLTTPLLPEAERDIINSAKQYGPLAEGLAEYQIGGSTSPLGLMGDYLPIVGPGLAKLGTTAASKLIGSGILGAGIPFAKLGKKVGLKQIQGKPVVFRGDPGVDFSGKAYEYVNPQYYNRGDTLGWMTHAAEDVKYPESYAYKRGSPIIDETSWASKSRTARPQITPLTSTAQNAVDLTKLPEDPEDVEKLIRGLEMFDPKKSPFGGRERLTLSGAKTLREDIPNLYRRQQEIDKKLREGAPLTDYEQSDLANIMEEMTNIRIPLNQRDISDKLGFDAIRYMDEDRLSWAFPDIGKLETPWKTKIGFSSMGEFPYHVMGRTGESNTPVGYFKTKKEAMKAAAKKGTGSVVEMGGERVATVPYARNYALEDYLLEDKRIQSRLGTKKYSGLTEPIEALDASPNQIKKFKEEGASYNSVADHFFDEAYDDLDEVQQKQVKDFTKWIEQGTPNLSPKSTGYFVDDALAAEKKDIEHTKAINAKAFELYGKAVKNLNDEEYLVVSSAINKTPKGWTSIEANKKPGEASKAVFDKKKYESPVSMNTLDKWSNALMVGQKPDEFFDMVIEKTGKSYYDLTPSEFEKLFHFNAESGSPVKLGAGTKEYSVTMPESKVELIEELFKGGASYEEAAELTFDKGWEQLTPSQKQYLIDIEDSTMPKVTLKNFLAGK